MSMPLPPILLWSAGIAGALALAGLIRRERRRINDELSTIRNARVDESDRASHPTLKRDPTTGVYRP
jgi:hypothetical protein